MPTATPFNFAGNTSGGFGSGFPFCPSKVNVADRGDGSPYDYWTTLSGWSKVSTPADDAAKATSISESLTLAMKIFWNYNGLSALDEYINIGGSSSSYSSTIDMDGGEYLDVLFQGNGFSSFENKAPNERVCYNSFSAVSVDQVLSFDINIIRMYDGITTDESNFVGYGISGNMAFLFGAYSELYIRSVLDEKFAEDEVVEYITIDGFDFIAWAIPFNNLDSPISITSSGSSVTAFFNYTDPKEETMTISDLDFYTY